MKRIIPTFESFIGEGKIKYKKGKSYQSGGNWTVVVDSNSSGLTIDVNNSAGWRLDPHDEKEETFELLDNGRQRAILTFKSGNIDAFAQQMHDRNSETTHGEQEGLSALDYADIIRVWIDMKKANESVVTESVFSFKTDNIEQLHFETDPKTAELMKIELGKSQGAFGKKKQIEDGEYSLRRFRKSINYGNGKDVGVFIPGSYDASVSKLGDGPHKKAVKAVKWNQRKYDQWLEDMAANGGVDNAFDMAQNAKNEPGLINWVKKQFRGDDPLQRVQWDIEAFAESVVNEKREDVGKYNTVKKAIKAIKKEYGPTPTEQSVASFINDNYYDVTEVERGDDDPQANDKIADLVAFYKFDIDDWGIAWADAQNESAVTEAKNTIGLAFKEEQDYLDFKEFVADQPRGAIRKNIGFDSKTKSWNVEMDVKVLDSIYGEGTPSNKESGWYGGLPDDFESVIIESVVTEAKDEVNAKQLANLQRDIAKINKNIKVYISDHPITKGDLQIELGADFDNDDEIDQINSLLKKHTGDWRTGTMFNESVLNEANKGKVHKAAKQGSYPASIVVIQKGKVIHQELVETPMAAPAAFNVIQDKYPDAHVHLEDNTGKRLFSESFINEARNYKEKPDGDHQIKATVCYLKPMTRQRECKAIYFKSKHDALGFKDKVRGFPKGAAVEAINKIK